MIKIGIEQNKIIETSAIIGFNFLLIIAGIIIYEYRIKHPNIVRVSPKPIKNFLAASEPRLIYFLSDIYLPNNQF